MTGIASGLVRTNRTDWRRRFSAKCGPSSPPLAAEPLSLTPDYQPLDNLTAGTGERPSL
jgi:hypothetical protein